nr:hypothetical protein [Eubacterium sp.]
YVKFIDGDRSAEITFPAGRVISNDGFEEKEIVALRYYVTQNKAQILKESEKVNVMKAFMDS